MNNSQEVISAFLDDRPFELQDLAITLEAPDSRALLIDLLALRRLVQPTDAIPLMSSGNVSNRSWLRLSVAVAAVVVAFAGGYVVGLKPAPAVAESKAPAPTRVVQVTSTSEDLPQGVRR